MSVEHYDLLGLARRVAYILLMNHFMKSLQYNSGTHQISSNKRSYIVHPMTNENDWLSVIIHVYKNHHGLYF